MRETRKALLIFPALVFLCVYVLLAPPGDSHLTRADPFSAATLTALAISAAVSAGTYAVNYFITTRRKVPPVDRGRFDDVRVQANGYGEFIPRGYGKFRIAGFLIDATEITHTTTTTPGQPGGKGTPKPPSPGEIRHVYTTTLAIGICEGLGALSSDLAITRIWEGTELIYDTTVETSGDALYEAEKAGNTLAGGAIAVSDGDASGGTAVEVPLNGSVQFNNVYGTGGNVRLEFYLRSTVANSVEMNFVGVPFTDSIGNTGGVYALGETTGSFTLSAGFVNTIKIKNLSATPFYLDYLIVRGSGQATGAVNPNIIQRDTDAADSLPFAGYFPQPDTTTGATTGTLAAGGNVGITIYTGTETQTANSALVAIHGAGNTPAYRGLVHVVLDAIQLKDPFIPHYTFEVDTGCYALDDIVTDLYSVVGVDSAKLELTAIASDTFAADEGFVISSREQASKWIEDLQTVFQFDMVEVDGKVKAVKRNEASAATLTAEELRGHWGEETPDDFEVQITDVDEQSLPARLELGYMDALNDYHNNVQTAMRLSGNAKDVQTVNLPMVLTASRARQLAETLLYQRHLEARSFLLKTGPKYQKLHPAKVITLALTNATHTIRLEEQGIAVMGPQEFKAVRAQASIYTQNVSGNSGSGYEPPVIPFPANTKFLIIDTALLRPEDGGDGTQPVVYVAASVNGTGTWRGAFLYKEVPRDSGSYEVRLALDTEAAIGTVVSGTAGTIDRTVWDRTTSLIVDYLPVTVLESITELQAMDSPELNLFALGSQATGWFVGQFTTVSAGTPAAGYQARYTVSGILWDRFATDAPAAGSLAGMDFVLLNAAVKPMRIEVEDIGRARRYRAASSGQSIEQSPPAASFTLEGISLKPPAPVDIRGDRDDDDNLLIRWRRRSRIAQQLRDYTDVPLAEERDVYELDIMDGATVVRTMRAITGMSLPAIFELTSRAKGDNVTNSSDTPLAGRSFQSITEPGNFIEATLTHNDNANVGLRAALGIVAPGVDWTETNYSGPTVFVPTTPEYYVMLTYSGGYILTVYRHGTIVATLTGVTISERIRITFSGSEVRFTRNWQSPSTPPFYVAHVAPVFPYHAYVYVRGGSGDSATVSKAVMTTHPLPATVYGFGQQTEDGLTPGDPVTLRLYQVSAVVGRGQVAEVTI